jgi:hypothetical protein
MVVVVSHSCACIGSPCLRQCVHGVSIGGVRTAVVPRLPEPLRTRYAAQVDHTVCNVSGGKLVVLLGCRLAPSPVAPRERGLGVPLPLGYSHCDGHQPARHTRIACPPPPPPPPPPLGAAVLGGGGGA